MFGVYKVPHGFEVVSTRVSRDCCCNDFVGLGRSLPCLEVGRPPPLASATDTNRSA